MYAMVYTRVDIAYVETVVSRFMSNPSKERWDVVKWIMKYLRGTLIMVWCFGSPNEKSMKLGPM